MENKQTIACFARIGDYGVPANILVERCLGIKTITCPPTTKRTMEIGSKNSPDTVCTPFKILLGNYMEAIEKGANLLVIPAIGCRLGFYDVLQREILTDLGYKFEILNLFDYTASTARIFKALSSYNPELTQEKFDAVFKLIVRIVIDMDDIGELMLKNRAFEINKGEFKSNYKKYLDEVKKAETADDAKAIGDKYKDILNNIKIDKPKNPVRIGLIGDLYSVMEPHGNCEMEEWLYENGVEIIRPTTLSNLAQTLFNVAPVIEKSGGYANYYIGGNANNTIAQAYAMAAGGGVDGMIHVKAATCSPEITAMTVLQNISRDFGIPVIYFTFDIETSEAGVHTRMEAFRDMLNMKRSNI